MKKIITFLGILLALAACKKKAPDPVPGNDPAPQKSKREMLIDGIWRPSDRRTTVRDTAGNIVGYSDFSMAQPCEKDGSNIFRIDGKVITDEGLLKCDTTDAQVDSSFNWELSTDDTQFTLLMGTSIVIQFTVLNISAGTAKLASHYPISINEVVDDTLTFTNIK